MALLQVENLTFTYPGEAHAALKDVSFSAESGEFIVVAGASGSGKTTLLKLLKPEIAPYGTVGGTIRYEGTLLSELEERKAVSGIGFVFQDPESQIVTDKVWHEMAFGLESLGLPNAEIRRRLAEISDYFGIGHLMDRDTADLSGGEKQMLNLASVLVMRPKLLLLDEPTAQLDPVAAVNFLHTLRKLNRETGLTILLVEHRLEEALPGADRLFLFDGGKLVYADRPEGAVRFFRDRPDHPMKEALPTAMRLFGAETLEKGWRCPVTVKEGRTYLQAHYGNAVKSLEYGSGAGNEVPATTLSLKNVWFRYEKESKDVLKNASLSVPEGAHFVILGGNGEGKSTALSLISGLLKPYRGEIELFGRKVSSWKQKELYRKGISLLPQDPKSLFLKKTVREDLLFLAETGGSEKAAFGARVLALADRFGLTAVLDRHPYDLSGGEQEKAALMKVLLTDPRLLLLDEPTKGVDAAFKKELQSILCELKAEGVTVLTVSHDVEFAAESADLCAFLFNGEFLPPESPTDFFSGNTFYTTAANRISRDHFDRAVRVEEVAELMRRNREGKEFPEA